MLTRAAPVHSVHVYEDDFSLISRLCAIFAAGLPVGDAVVVIATHPHREKLVRCLRSHGIDVPSYARPGRFRMFDAVELLSLFMEHGSSDRKNLLCAMDTILRDAQNASCSKDRGLIVFGEMVSLLWDGRDREGAIELEMLWNDLLNERAFHLHCAYPRDGLINGEEGELDAVCGLHSHVLIDPCEMAA